MAEAFGSSVRSVASGCTFLLRKEYHQMWPPRDRAIRGASTLRPGYQQLLEDARRSYKRQALWEARSDTVSRSKPNLRLSSLLRLTYLSQSERIGRCGPGRARTIRMKVGGGPNLLAAFSRARH
jgi:hypothetical protein